MKAPRKPNSSNFQNRTVLARECALSAALERISGRWKMQTLYAIKLGEARFSRIKKRLPGISDRMLGLRLEELAEEGLIAKDVARLGVEYRLLPQGQRLMEIMDDVMAWSGGLP